MEEIDELTLEPTEEEFPVVEKHGNHVSTFVIIVALVFAFVVGVFVGAVVIPSIITPPTRLIIQCINNSSGIMETVKLVQGLP
jgi:hypothetical protein